MSKMHARLVGRFVCVLSATLLSCSSEEQTVNRFDMVRNVCKTDRVIPNSISAVQNISGSIIYGDVTNQAISQLPEVWVSIYATRRPELSRTTTGVGFCCSMINGFYYCGQQICRRTETEDVSYLYGRGVAKTQEEAEGLAEDNCKQIVDQWQTTNDRRLPYSLGCRKLVTQSCS